VWDALCGSIPMITCISSSMVSVGWDRDGHSYFGSCSRWITSLEPHHGEAPIGCSSFSSQTRERRPAVVSA
jgi:hypothetical protein